MERLSFDQFHALTVLQKVLDGIILANNPNPPTKEVLRDNTFLALSVELSELANEVRCFKHWSKKEASPNHTTLEEYADALHFLLSLINQYDGLVEVDFEYKPLKKPKEELTQCFLYTNAILMELWTTVADDDRTSMLFGELLSSFVELGSALGFSNEDVHKAYLRKYLTNIERQRSGY